MRPLLLSTFDERGGAARAAGRLLIALRQAGHDARMLVQQKDSDSPFIEGTSGSLRRGWARARSVIDAAPVGAYHNRRRSIFSPAWLPSHAPRQATDLEPDVINLHWVAAGFVSIEDVPKFRRPVVWTMHDMWVVTGGCHHSGGCTRFADACGRCPMLASTLERDLSRLVFRRKEIAWRKTDSLSVVTPARWMAEMVEQSPLFEGRRIDVVPNGIDTAMFRPIPRATARDLLGLPPEDRLIAFGAVDPHNASKGGHLLQSALRILRDEPAKDVALVVFGASREALEFEAPYPIYALGTIRDDLTLALMYSAADVTVVPSVIETFSNVALESMACGTPVVAFDVGGFPDVIDHRSNGYLASPYEPSDLAKGIGMMIGDASSGAGERARSRVVSDFGAHDMARRYLEVFEGIASSR